VAVVARARQIEERLTHFRSSGHGTRRLGHQELIQAFLQDLTRRANASEIDPATVRRYQAALRHYEAFVEQPDIGKGFPRPAGVNREFQLTLTAFLSNRLIAPNGHPNAQFRRMQDPGFVEDAVRALFEWAADPDRGGLLPDGFRNPFLRKGRRRTDVVRDLMGEPDITLAMAVDFLNACDDFQLKLFAPMILYGLRAAEPCFLFAEHIRDGWVKIQCIDGLSYKTKGRRDKRFPVLPCLHTLWKGLDGHSRGLFFQRRGVVEGQTRAPLQGASLPEIEEELARRCAKCRVLDAAQRSKLRDGVLKEAGGLTYDHIKGEFKKVAERLKWSGAATVKDFRHLFSSLLENAGIPEFYRRYLMGHSPGKAAIVNYTHLNKVKGQFERAVHCEFGPIVDAVERRARKLGLTH
jgi:integrase